MKSKTIRIFIIIICCLLWLFAVEETLRRVFGGFAGSYPWVETWEINAPEKDIIEAIKELKKEDTSLQPPNDQTLSYKRDSGYIKESIEMKGYETELKYDSTAKLPIMTEENSYGDSENNYKDFWLYIDFYYSDTKEVVHTWTRPEEDSSITTFAFYSLSDKNRQNENLINKDFWYLSNRIQINKFKKRIVDRIQAKIDKKKSSN